MPEVQNVVTRAQTFAAAGRDFHHMTLLSVAEATGVSGYLITPDKPGADRAAFSLAQSVAARCDPVDELPDLSGTRVIGTMRVDVKAAVSRDTQKGADPAETARRIESALRTGAEDSASWLAANVRRPGRRERKRTLAWHARRLGVNGSSFQHHTTDTNSMVATFLCGGEDRAEVKQRMRQVAAALPGFDLDTKTRILRPWLAMLPPVLIGLAVGTAAYFLDRPLSQSLIAVGIGVVLALVLLVGLIPTRTRTVVRDARRGKFHGPRRTHSLPAIPGLKRKPSADDDDDKPGDYPLTRDAFLVGPALLVGMIAPHAGAASGSSVTERRAASAAMLNPDIGPWIGTSGEDNARTHLSVNDFTAGTVAIGKPGSGKSVVVRSLFGWACLERVAPSGRVGYPGRSNTLIAFESKGEGAAKYRQWSDALGDRTLVIDVADPESFAIDVFDLPGTLAERARLFANMMVYAFADGSIQGASFEVLQMTLSGALVVTDTIALAASLPHGRSPIFYCHILLGGQGDTRGRDLAAAISEAAARAEKAGESAAQDLVVADDELTKLYSSGTESSRRAQTQAARNKIGDLLSAESWWSPIRPKVTWQQIITGHKSVVINTGVSGRGHQLDERIAVFLTGILTYSMVETIKRACTGWQEQQRWVSIYSDELSQMAGASASTLGWLHDQGRSYGVRPFLATQRLAQLPLELKTSIMDYATVLWFAQSSAPAATDAVLDMAADGSAWSNADVTGLELYTAIVRTYVAGVRQPAVPVRMTNFEADIAGFAHAQGYLTAGAATPDRAIIERLMSSCSMSKGQAPR
ncbi:MAG: hypothetical protein WKF57_06600 [Nakamurella sp.]